MIPVILQDVISACGSVISLLLNLLPDTPFNFDGVFGADSVAGTSLGFMNYFVPVSSMLAVLAAWLVAIGVWYAARWALRVVRFIG